MANSERSGRRLAILAGTAAMAVLFAIATGSWYPSARLQRSARLCSEEFVKQIVEGWSDDALLQRASPQFRDSVNPQELKLGFSVLAQRVGGLKACSPAHGAVRRAEGKPLTAAYAVPCQFEQAAATIHITLIRAGDGWQILGFSVDSPAVRAGSPTIDGLKPYQPDPASPPAPP